MAPPSIPSKSAASQRTVSDNKYRVTRRPIPGRLDHIKTEVVKVLVGKSEEAFMVHIGHLISTSDFFKAMLRSGANFKENNESTIKLPECLPETFSLYVEFIYAGQISMDKTLDVTSQYWPLTRLIRLADYIQSVELYNVAIDAFIDVCKDTNKSPPLTVVQTAYDDLQSDSSFIQLLVDMTANSNCYAEKDVPTAMMDSKNLGVFWFRVAQAMKKTEATPGDAENGRGSFGNHKTRYHRQKIPTAQEANKSD
ncbi:hypothetical protein BT63DRAFT_472815 [Microthyrium microscopicum]|uniref:BTB domain-containing protein n=1 Tax=Microthyrium microscopicum TaxID=703497 RepID=A0A6A6U7G8_9PEZI|nr:hypothetical protein BT63DRAFT_472815 [Microthyrium microscopicum]